MKRTKESPKKAPHVAQEAVHGKETPKVDIAPAPAPEKPKTEEIAPYDTCRYHFDFPPKVFKAGEVIPEGWKDTPAKIPGFPWQIDGVTGVWSKKEA